MNDLTDRHDDEGKTPAALAASALLSPLRMTSLTAVIDGSLVRSSSAIILNCSSFMRLILHILTFIVTSNKYIN